MVQNHSHDYGTIPCTPAIRSSIWYQAPPSQVFQLSDHERTTSSSTHGCPWPPQWMRNISKAWLSTVVFIKYTPNPDPSNIITRSLSNIYRWQKWATAPSKIPRPRLHSSLWTHTSWMAKPFQSAIIVWETSQHLTWTWAKSKQKHFQCWSITSWVSLCLPRQSVFFGRNISLFCGSFKSFS